MPIQCNGVNAIATRSIVVITVGRPPGLVEWTEGAPGR
jgi:hypothetical protein